MTTTTDEARRFFLRFGDGPWREVSKGEWARVERSAGFDGSPRGEPSTTGFAKTMNGVGVSGRILPSDADHDYYDYDPAFQRAAWPERHRSGPVSTADVREARDEALEALSRPKPPTAAAESALRMMTDALRETIVRLAEALLAERGET